MKINALMKELQKVQAEAEKAQDELRALIVEGSAGGGAVKVRISGAYKVQGIELSDDVFRDGDKEMLEDMIRAALDDALGQIDSKVRESTSKAMSGISIPGMPSLF